MYTTALQTAIGLLHEPERCNVLQQKRPTKNYNLAITVDKNYRKLVPLVVTLPQSYYMNVEFNEKFDKRNCLGQWHAICHHFRVTL